MAKAMKWVKETLAPLDRANDSFRAVRLISKSRADTVRTLVAVGTARLAFILLTMRAAAPRNGVASASIATTGLTAAGATDVATVGTVERW
jgi:hypothetical protein